MKKQRVLITGGAGYIGSATTRGLLSSSYEPIVIDRHIPISWKRMFPDVRAYKKNLLDVKSLMGVFLETLPVAVIHLASEVARPEENVQVTKNILRVMLSAHCSSLIYASSAAIYGNTFIKAKETDKPQPINPYGRSKVVCEKLLFSAAKRNINTVILRYFNVCGKTSNINFGWSTTGKDNLFASMYKTHAKKDKFIKIRGCEYKTEDGTANRDWVHVSDVARANILALSYIMQQHKSAVFNIASGKSHSVGEVIKTWEKELGIHINSMCVPAKESEIVSSRADIRKARKILSWRPEASLLPTIIKSYMIH